MGLFKKKVAQAGKNTVSNTAIAEELSIEETKNTLDSTQVTMDELIEKLREIQLQSFKDKMKKAAYKNAELEKQKQGAEEETQENAKKAGQNIFDKRGLYENLYIFPDDLQGYTDGISIIIQVFSSKTSADWVATGGYQLLCYLNEYVIKLKEALKSGQKLKANACIDILKYAIKIVCSEKESTDEEILRKQQEQQMEFIRETCKLLLETIDAYYSRLKGMEIDERLYKEAYDSFMELEEKIEEIPQEYKNRLDSLGFKNAMNTLPPGDALRQYFPVLQAAQAATVNVLYKCILIESALLSLVDLKGEIKAWLEEVERVLNTDGDNYDFIIHKETIQRFRTRSINKAKEMQAQVVTSQKMNNELEALVKEAATNVELGASMADSMASMRNLKRMNEKNEQFMVAVERQRKEIEEKKTAMQEKSFQQEEDISLENDKILLQEG